MTVNLLFDLRAKILLGINLASGILNTYLDLQIDQAPRTVVFLQLGHRKEGACDTPVRVSNRNKEC